MNEINAFWFVGCMDLRRLAVSRPDMEADKSVLKRMPACVRILYYFGNERHDENDWPPNTPCGRPLMGSFPEGVPITAFDRAMITPIQARHVVTIIAAEAQAVATICFNVLGLTLFGSSQPFIWRTIGAARPLLRCSPATTWSASCYRQRRRATAGTAASGI